MELIDRLETLLLENNGTMNMHYMAPLSPSRYCLPNVFMYIFNCSVFTEMKTPEFSKKCRHMGNLNSPSFYFEENSQNISPVQVSRLSFEALIQVGKKLLKMHC